MESIGNRHSTERDTANSRGWMSKRNTKGAGGNGRDMSDKPIPRPTTELGFRGIRHKTSGHGMSSSPETRDH